MVNKHGRIIPNLLPAILNMSHAIACTEPQAHVETAILRRSIPLFWRGESPRFLGIASRTYPNERFHGKPPGNNILRIADLLTKTNLESPRPFDSKKLIAVDDFLRVFIGH